MSKACKVFCRSKIEIMSWNPASGMENFTLAFFFSGVLWRHRDKLIFYILDHTTCKFKDLVMQKTGGWANQHFSTILKTILMKSI